jgi:uncharacterized protein (TIGR01777 family)
VRLLLLGCTGLVGRALVPLLAEAGHDLVVVSRRPAPPAAGQLLQLDVLDPVAWASQGPLAAAVAAVDGVVNLTGEPIAEKRWTPAHRALLRASRVEVTQRLAAAITAAPVPPQVLVSGSAVGYYGTSVDGCFDEESPCGDDTLAELCRDWEAAAQAVPSACRVVRLRTGIVLAPEAGALGRMLPLFRAGLGGPVGDGRQWMSWIDRSDLCAVIAEALANPAWGGALNGTAPSPVTMAEFCATLGRVLSRPSLLPVPAPVLQLLLGDGARVVLEGQRVLPRRLQALGFRFRFPELSAALAAATSPERR